MPALGRAAKTQHLDTLDATPNAAMIEFVAAWCGEYANEFEQNFIIENWSHVADS